MKFPYQRYTVHKSPERPDGVLHRPMTSLRVIGQTGEAVLWALVDTGADNCVLPRSVTDELGIQLDDERQATLGGFGGSTVRSSPAKVELQLGRDGQSFHWTATVAVVEFEAPAREIAILGHAGCLDYFQATFDGERLELELVPTAKFPGSVSGTGEA